MYPFAYILFYVLSGVLLGTSIVAIYIYNPIVDFVDFNKNTDYNDRYTDFFNNLDDIELTEEEQQGLKNKFLYENTPCNNILMYYNKDNDVFEYYSSTPLEYDVLTSVARKYVVKYNCKDIFKEVSEDESDCLSPDDNEDKNTNDSDSDSDDSEKNIYVCDIKTVEQEINKVVKDYNRFRHCGESEVYKNILDKKK